MENKRIIAILTIFTAGVLIISEATKLAVKWAIREIDKEECKDEE